jgi:hypothetical protein
MRADDDVARQGGIIDRSGKVLDQKRQHRERPICAKQLKHPQFRLELSF